MNANRRSYDADYKPEGVRLAVELNNITSVAQDLGTWYWLDDASAVG